jgi:hypothetical protein
MAGTTVYLQLLCWAENSLHDTEEVEKSIEQILAKLDEEGYVCMSAQHGQSWMITSDRYLDEAFIQSIVNEFSGQDWKWKVREG